MQPQQGLQDHVVSNSEIEKTSGVFSVGLTFVLTCVALNRVALFRGFQSWDEGKDIAEGTSTIPAPLRVDLPLFSPILKYSVPPSSTPLPPGAALMCPGSY